jgi:Sulfotransferase family
MTDAPDWTAMEARIARLLPDPHQGISHDRPLLLGELSAYAASVVREARRLGAVGPTQTERERALGWLRFPVFVCGHHRTGTTLLQNLLDGHPDLRVIPNEATYLTSYAYAAHTTVSPEATNRFAADWICRFVDPNFSPHFNLGRSQAGDNPSLLFVRRLLGWQDALGDAWPACRRFTLLLSLVVAFGDVVSPLDVPRMWVDKTPLNEKNAVSLAQTFPEARFIQVVREPAATLASVIEAYRWERPVAESNFRRVWAINRSLELAARNHERLGPRYLIVRYEDLCRAPGSEMERVRGFLTISPHPSLVVPSVGGRPVRSNSSFKRGDAGVVVPPRSTPSLSMEADQLVRALTAARARDFGYDVRPLPLLRRLALLMREAPRYTVDRSRAMKRRWFPDGG